MAEIYRPFLCCEILVKNRFHFFYLHMVQVTLPAKNAFSSLLLLCSSNSSSCIDSALLLPTDLSRVSPPRCTRVSSGLGLSLGGTDSEGETIKFLGSLLFGASGTTTRLKQTKNLHSQSQIRASYVKYKLK